MLLERWDEVRELGDVGGNDEGEDGGEEGGGFAEESRGVDGSVEVKGAVVEVVEVEVDDLCELNVGHPAEVDDIQLGGEVETNLVQACSAKSSKFLNLT